MAVKDTIQSIKTNVANAYTKLQGKGATIPANKNIENLASAIDTVTGGGSVEGTIYITTNGTYDVAQYASADVKVETSTEPIEPPILAIKTITENGTYNAEDDGADGYSSVIVNVAGGGGSDDLNKLIQNTATSITVNLPTISNYAFYQKNNLQTINGTIDANTPAFQYAFSGTSKLTKANIKINYNGTATKASNVFVNAFGNCGQNIAVNNSEVDVYLSSNVTLTADSNYKSMFYYAHLRKVVFGDGFEVIGNQVSKNLADMFNYANIKELYLENVTQIEGYDTSSNAVFGNNSGVQKIYLPKLTNWGRGAIGTTKKYWKMFFGADSCTLYNTSSIGSTAKKFIRYNVLDNYSSATSWVSFFTNDGAVEAQMFVYGDFASGDTLPTQVGTTQVYNVAWYEDDDFKTLASTVNTARYYGKISAVV